MFLSGFLQGQGQKSDQKHETKKLVKFHNQPASINYDVTVENDESKFGKMKYHKGCNIEGQWVFGGIFRETKACFLVPVERRDKETLLPITRAQILPGTCVMSDMWKAYDCLQDEGYHHLTVNHRLNFVDPYTLAHHT